MKSLLKRCLTRIQNLRSSKLIFLNWRLPRTNRRYCRKTLRNMTKNGLVKCDRWPGWTSFGFCPWHPKGFWHPWQGRVLTKACPWKVPNYLCFLVINNFWPPYVYDNFMEIKGFIFGLRPLKIPFVDDELYSFWLKEAWNWKAYPLTAFVNEGHLTNKYVLSRYVCRC